MKKVTIIIPTYKRSEFIERAIISALNQKKIIAEVIVVDDNGAGTEDQKQIEKQLTDYIRKGLIKYIVHEENINGSAARNTGISSATGDFISFLDDDDWIDPNKLHKQINLMDIEKSDACLCGFVRIYNNGESPLAIPKLNGNVRRKLLAFEVDSCAGSCLTIRKNVIDKIGMFDITFTRHQDLEYLYRVSKVTHISVVNENMTSIYLHSGNRQKRSGNEIMTYRYHFLNTFKNDILNMNEDDRDFILDKHYKAIAKSYLKNKKYIETVKWVLKTSDSMRTSVEILVDLTTYLKKKKNHVKFF